MTYRSACTCYCHGPNGETRALHIMPCCMPDPPQAFVEDGWIPLEGWIDPPEAPNGFITEIHRQDFMGIPLAYRYIELKKCPFCGGKPENKGVMVQCTSCGAATYNRKWNNRV